MGWDQCAKSVRHGTKKEEKDKRKLEVYTSKRKNKVLSKAKDKVIGFCGRRVELRWETEGGLIKRGKKMNKQRTKHPLSFIHRT